VKRQGPAVAYPNSWGQARQPHKLFRATTSVASTIRFKTFFSAVPRRRGLGALPLACRPFNVLRWRKPRSRLRDRPLPGGPGLRRGGRAPTRCLPPLAKGDAVRLGGLEILIANPSPTLHRWICNLRPPRRGLHECWSREETLRTLTKDVFKLRAVGAPLEVLRPRLRSILPGGPSPEPQAAMIRWSERIQSRSAASR